MRRLGLIVLVAAWWTSVFAQANPEVERALLAAPRNLRDGAMVALAGLLAWSIAEIHTLSNDVTALKSNHVTQEQHAELERHFTDLLNQAHKEQIEATRSILGQLTGISSDLGKIAGKLEAREARDSAGRR